MQKVTADPQKVVNVVDHALTARRPKNRYLLDTASRVHHKQEARVDRRG